MKFAKKVLSLGLLMIGLSALQVNEASAYVDAQRSCGRVWDAAHLAVRNSVPGYTRECSLVPGGGGNVSCDDGDFFFFQNCVQNPISQGGLMCDACGVFNVYALMIFL